MKTIYLVILSLNIIVSCNTKNNNNSIYFGGEILHPKSEYIVLMQNEDIIDSIKINNDNTFEKIYDSLSPGLYFFKHGNEFQYVYFDLKDSLKIRLNTWDFDESLVFEGIGSEKNDFLINMFLQNENEKNNYYSYFPLNEKDFLVKANETYSKNYHLLTNFLQTNPQISLDFKYLAEAIVKYPVYTLKEMYPYFHKKMSDSIIEISNQYWDFRKDTNLNDIEIIDYYAYQNYLHAYIFNETRKKFDTILSYSNEDFSAEQIRNTAQIIKNEKIKNRLLYQQVFDWMINTESEENNKILDLFYSNCTDEKVLKKIRNIHRLKKDLPIGSKFPLLKLKNESNEIFLNIAKENNPTIIYFWHNEITSKNFIINRVNYLSKKYPSINFIGLHKNKNSFIKCNNNFENQFFVTDSIGLNMFPENYPRTIILDKHGTVVNNFIMLSDATIENVIKKIL